MRLRREGHCPGSDQPVYTLVPRLRCRLSTHDRCDQHGRESFGLGRWMTIQRTHPLAIAIASSFEFFVCRLLAQELQKGGFLCWEARNTGPYLFSRASSTAKSPTPSPAHAKCSSSALRRFPPFTLYALLKKDSQLRARQRASEDSCSRYCTIALSPCTKVSSWRW